MHIPALTFYHFDSVHFTPRRHNPSFFLSFFLSRWGSERFSSSCAGIGGSEDDNETLDDSSVPPTPTPCRLLSVSVSPLARLSAFDQLQIQPKPLDILLLTASGPRPSCCCGEREGSAVWSRFLSLRSEAVRRDVWQGGGYRLWTKRLFQWTVCKILVIVLLCH